jgi:hypothetical protein
VLDCLRRTVVRLRLLSVDNALPQHLRIALWETCLDVDDVLESEQDTVILPIRREAQP